jgi:hypothetical protein
VAGRKPTALPGNIKLPILFNTSLLAVSEVASEIQTLEIYQIFTKSFVLERNGTFVKFR